MSSADENPIKDRPGIGPADSGAIGSHVDPATANRKTSQEAGPAPVVVQQGMDFDEGLSVEDLRRRLGVMMAIVWRYWHFGALTAIVVAGAFAWYMLSQPVLHSASTTFLAQRTLEQILVDASPARPAGGVEEGALKNHLSVMESRAFRKRFAESFTTEEQARIQEPYLMEEEVPTGMDIAAGAVSVSRERGREFFIVTAQHQDRQVALMLADRFLVEYKKMIQDEILSARNQSTLYLRERAEELADEIKELEDERRRYRLEYNLISVQENQGILAERLARTNSALSQVKLEKLAIENNIKQAEADLEANSLPFENPTLAMFGNNQVLRQQLEVLKNERDLLGQQFGPNHPRMKEAQRNIEGVENILKSNFRLALEDLKTKLRLAEDSERQLTEELNSVFAESLELDRMAGGFNRLGDELAAKEMAQAELLQRISRIDVSGEAPVDAIKIVDEAFLKPGNTMRIFMIIAGVAFLGGGAFVGVPLVLYTFTDRVTGSMDLEAQFKLDTLGVIPKLSSVPALDRPHIVRDNVDLEHVESFLAIAAQLDISSAVPYPKRIVVTSTVPGEGKSMLVSNMASTFTRYGRKTVLVDFDFRRPIQQDLHDIPDDRGFLAWAAADCPMGDDIFEPGGPLGLTVLPDGTSLIPTGGVHVQPGRFLVAKATIALLDRLSSEFDVVMIDSPPAGLFQDALILARYCQETVLVVREGRPHITQIKKVLSDLDRMPTRVAGMIINGFSRRSTHPSMSYKYTNYGKYGYGYSGRYRHNGKNGKYSSPEAKVAATAS